VPNFPARVEVEFLGELETEAAASAREVTALAAQRLAAALAVP
jgi:hypothetical protein